MSFRELLNKRSFTDARFTGNERDTSVSALVRQFLVDLAKDSDEFERLEQLEKAVREQITEFNASDRLSRDELYDRRR